MKLRAIDLFSGMGGWSVALRAIGAEVVCSYDIWETANHVHRRNVDHQVETCDIRNLDVAELPEDIDIVVGSPPCTEFSFSNRGGAGDIDDGLKDIGRFLEIVVLLKPKYWLMENVPRVKGILERELAPGGQLEEFSHLEGEIAIWDASLFGLAQRRKRCLFGNYDASLMRQYENKDRYVTLGEVIQGLQQPTVVDPHFEFKVPVTYLTDNVKPLDLDSEEFRINRAAKQFHPVYNRMAFPDDLNRPSRTVTATCTNVSRESIVVEDPSTNKVRRLSVRERATLQGFPITYSLGDIPASQKIRMIGNAIPPQLAYMALHASIGTPPKSLKRITWSPPTEASLNIEACSERNPNKSALPRFPRNRTFRFAIPSLHFGSGVRFELTNRYRDDPMNWGVTFVYGTSKDIRTHPLDEDLGHCFANCDNVQIRLAFSALLESVEELLQDVNLNKLQGVWSRRESGDIHPFKILDSLETLVLQAKNQPFSKLALDFGVLSQCLKGYQGISLHGLSESRKMQTIQEDVFLGLMLGSVFNTVVAAKQSDFER